MTRVSATPISFVSGDYTITNDTINFSNTSYISKATHRPIGTNLLLFAIRFENLDAKNHYWYYPDQATRDADYTTLDNITSFGGCNGGNGSLDPNASTKAKQEENIAKLTDVETKLQALIDKPDYETIYRIGFDSNSLQNEKFGTLGSTEFGQGAGTPPTIVTIDDASFSWTVSDRKYWVLAPIDFDFSNTLKVNIYFKFENIGNSIGLNRVNFYLQYEQSPNNWLTVTSKFSNFLTSNTTEIIHLYNSNEVLKASNYRIVIQERGTNDETVYPSNFKLELLGITDNSTSFITEYQRLENNVVVSTEYQDAQNQPYTLVGDFILDTNERTRDTTQEYLIHLTTLLEQLQRSNFEQVQIANDYVQTINYLDEADRTNRRPDTIVHSSSSLGLTVTETFTYAGATGDYYFISKSLS